MSGSMKKQTIVVLSVSVGAGHLRAAEAIKVTVEQGYKDIQVIHVDVMDLVPAQFRKLYVDTYLKIVQRHPSLWGHVYRFTDQEKKRSRWNNMRRHIERLNTLSLHKMLVDIQPDHIICTHFLPASILSQMIEKKQVKGSTWVVDTDFDIHAMWIYEWMSGYFAADEEIAWRMRNRGIDSTRIHVTGIPIMPAFSKKLDRDICARELEINPSKTTLLLMSGGAGLGDIDLLAEQLIEIQGDFQIIALAGKNESLLGKLNKLALQYPDRLFPMGFTNAVERVMAVSDLAITKPGGLTTSECLAMELPMIIVSPLPGQEERNADYLLEHGVAMKAYDVPGLEYRVRKLLKQPFYLAEMRRRLQGIGKPQAAQDILRIVLGE
jgi:processive 1,2-diacylglycerol beta-glucosyltransferase